MRFYKKYISIYFNNFFSYYNFDKSEKRIKIFQIFKNHYLFFKIKNLIKVYLKKRKKSKNLQQKSKNKLKISKKKKKIKIIKQIQLYIIN